MTKKEAIQILKSFRNRIDDQYRCSFSDVIDALDVAIHTLEQSFFIVPSDDDSDDY